MHKPVSENMNIITRLLYIIECSEINQTGVNTFIFSWQSRSEANLLFDLLPVHRGVSSCPRDDVCPRFFNKLKNWMI